MIRVAVTGAHGRLGSQLLMMGCIPLECDITKPADIELALAIHKPDVVINCAAMTNVDECDTAVGWKKALNVNVHGVENLRNAFTGRLIHLSTDYIFDGKHGPYTEKWGTDDNPVNLYGSSKLGGEIVLNTSPHKDRESLIVRTTGLFGGFGHKSDIVDLVIDTLSGGRELRMTSDLCGNQTYAPFLAEALLKLAEMEWKYPVINVASDDIMSRYEFGLMIASVWGLNKELLHSCSNKDIQGWTAPRPTKGGLRTARAKRLRLPIYTVLDGIKAYRDATRKV